MPASAWAWPAMIFRRVVFPDPFAPISPTFSLGLIWKDTSRSTDCDPKDFETLLSWRSTTSSQGLRPWRFELWDLSCESRKGISFPRRRPPTPNSGDRLGTEASVPEFWNARIWGQTPPSQSVPRIHQAARLVTF